MVGRAGGVPSNAVVTVEVARPLRRGTLCLLVVGQDLRHLCPQASETLRPLSLLGGEKREKEGEGGGCMYVTVSRNERASL